MKLLQKIHTAYGALVFCILFLLFFIPLLVPILFPTQFRWVGILNRWWARLFFALIFIPFRVDNRSNLDPNQRYIFCPNHFSYLDIPTMGLNPMNTIFVGKNDMEKVPLFGFMYRKLHITVDRSRLKSKFNTLVRSLQAIDDGKNLVIYPEGGILSHEPPLLAHFKDGAFRAAIEKQIPIVPVTIPYNWIILPDETSLLLRWGVVKVIFHEPVESKGMGLDRLDELKHKVYEVIQTELKKHHP
jgi:1-acyl-sn-glycerol-3-phosphate acyltransferase